MTFRNGGHEKDGTIGALSLGDSGLNRPKPDDATLDLVAGSALVEIGRLYFHNIAIYGLIMKNL